MSVYKVKSGQNIYDVAMTLYGSVEGIFYLLAANEWLTLETTLTSGMELTYSEDLIINQQIPIWLQDNSIKVKNGEHIYDFLEIEDYVRKHFSEKHPETEGELKKMSPDEQTMFWDMLTIPRMIIQHQGQISTLIIQLRNDSHLIIDWGDYSEPTIIDGTELKEVDHYYKSESIHKITLYGDFTCSLMDLTEVNGIHYPLDTMYIKEFKSKINFPELNKLIIPT